MTQDTQTTQQAAWPAHDPATYRRLPAKTRPVDPSVVEQPAFTWVLGTDVSIGPVQVPRAVDLRQDGRIAVHVWAPRAVVTVTDTPRDAVTDSNA